MLVLQLRRAAGNSGILPQANISLTSFEICGLCDKIDECKVVGAFLDDNIGDGLLGAIKAIVQGISRFGDTESSWCLLLVNVYQIDRQDARVKRLTLAVKAQGMVE